MNAQTIVDWVSTLSDESSMVDEVKRLAPQAIDCLPMLINLLQNPGQDIRNNAAYVLGCMGHAGEGAIPALAGILMDLTEPSCVRDTAAWALWAIGTASLPLLVEVLKTSDVHGRKQAANQIRSFGLKAGSAVPALIDALNDDDKGVRDSAVSALKYIGEPAVPLLVQALSAKHAIVRISAARAILEATPGHLRATEEAIECLNDTSGAVRRDAALALMSRAGAYPQLQVSDYSRLLNDSEKYVREFAALALRNLGTDARLALQDLITALDDPELFVRSFATEALGNLGAEAHTAVPQLIDHLINDFTTQETAEALGRIGPQAASALPALEDILKTMHDLDHEDKEAVAISSATQLAILQIRGERPNTVAVPLYKAELHALVREVKEKDPVKSIRAMFALIGRGEEAVDPLVGLLTDKDVAVRATALSGIRELGPRAVAAVSALRNGLSDQETYSSTPMNTLFALTLAKVGDAGIAALKDAAASGDSVVRHAAAKVLMEL